MLDSLRIFQKSATNSIAQIKQKIEDILEKTEFVNKEEIAKQFILPADIKTIVTKK